MSSKSQRRHDTLFIGHLIESGAFSLFDSLMAADDRGVRRPANARQEPATQPLSAAEFTKRRSASAETVH